MTRNSIWRLAAALSALLAAPWAFADQGNDVVSLLGMPGGVADASGTTGYISNVNGYIVAVDLGNGKEKWAGPHGDYPVAVIGDRVLVLNVDPKSPNVLHLSIFETTTGQTVLNSDPVAFANWVDLRQGAQTFGFVPRIVDGGLWLHCRARAGKKEANRAVHIDLTSGKVDMLAADKMPPPPMPVLSAALTKLAQRDYETAAGPETGVLTAGTFVAAVDVVKDGATRKVILRRWNPTTEQEQPAVTLAQGAHLQTRLLRDASLIAVRSGEAGRWRLMSLETGKARATLPAIPGMLEAAFIGGRFYFNYVGPPPADLLIHVPGAPPGTRVAMLFAVDLATGKWIWRKPLDPDNPFWQLIGNGVGGEGDDGN